MLGKHFTLNMIRISDEDFTGTDRSNIDVVIQDVRDIFEQAGVGVNIDHLHVDRADADGFRVITRPGRSRKVLRRFRGPGRHNLDALLVLVLQIPEGDGYVPARSAGFRNTSKCRSKDWPGMRGVIAGMNFGLYGFGWGATSPIMRARSLLGQAVAHEVGHLLLGRDHHDDIDNLMSERSGGSDNLTDSQGSIIRSRCAVTSG
jgi:hypothetical protein